jgi:serine/threonine protein kinase
MVCARYARCFNSLIFQANCSNPFAARPTTSHLKFSKSHSLARADYLTLLAQAGLYDEPYGPEIDVWSIGVIVTQPCAFSNRLAYRVQAYVLLCGYFPFQSGDEPEVLYKNILESNYFFPSNEWDNISANGLSRSCAFPRH